MRRDRAAGHRPRRHLPGCGVSGPTLDEGLAEGKRCGFIGAEFCAAHDMLPMTETERDAFEVGDDPCLPSLRVRGAA